MERLWNRGDHLLCAVSGGADSVALLRMLCERRDAGEIYLSAAHFEHGIRGGESLRDAAFARDLCEGLNVPFHLGGGDVPALAARRGVGIEQAARDARFDFLRRTRARIGADWIALAHHMDDQAETVLMHMLRGAGARGAAGMAPSRDEVIRPLLCMRRAELIAYLKSIGQPYVTDSTNLEPDGPRNRLRLEVMPLLEGIYPGAVPALGRFAQVQRQQADALDRVAADWMRSHVRHLPMGAWVRYDRQVDAAIARIALMRLLAQPDHATVERAHRAYTQDCHAVCQLPGGQAAERGRAGLYIVDLGADKPPPALLRDGARLAGVCAVSMTPFAPVAQRDTPFAQVLSADALEGAALRTREAQDRFQMLGAPGDRLLSDVLTDRKIDRAARDFLPLIANGSRVLWMPGVGVSEQAKLSGDPGQRAAMLRCEWEGGVVPPALAD